MMPLFLKHRDNYYYDLFIYTWQNCKILLKYNWNSIQLFEVNYPVRKNPNIELQLDKILRHYHWDIIHVQTAESICGFCLLDFKKYNKR